MRNIFKLLTALSLFCLNIGLNANAMEDVKVCKDQNAQNLISNPFGVDLTLIKKVEKFSNENNSKQNDNINICEIENSGHKNIEIKNDFNNKSSNTKKVEPYIKHNVNNNIALKMNYPFNLLVVADTKSRMQKVMALIENNDINSTLGSLTNFNFESGGIYHVANNENINVLCITLDDFITSDYDWDFICQNTSKIFYVFNVDSQNDKSYFEKLKKFYHKFNKHWCGKDVRYKENYEPYLNTIWEPNFKGPVLSKGRNDWFEYVRVKRNLLNHRYIYFLLDSKERNCSEEFNKYVASMPDARSISLCELDNDSTMGILLKNIQMREDVPPQEVILFNNDNIKKMSFKKIGLISTGGIGAIGTVAAISSLIKKNLSTKPKITKPEVKNKEVNKPGNNKLLT